MANKSLRRKVKARDIVMVGNSGILVDESVKNDHLHKHNLRVNDFRKIINFL